VVVNVTFNEEGKILVKKLYQHQALAVQTGSDSCFTRLIALYESSSSSIVVVFFRITHLLYKRLFSELLIS